MTGWLVRDLYAEGEELDAEAGRPVARQLALIVDRFLLRLKALMEARASLASQCESPIEVDLGAAVLVDLVHIFDEYKLKLVPQFRWSRYRADFAIVKARKAVLFLECDGRDFHSTPDQIAKDARKDAAAERFGVPLLRFSGSDIFRFPDECTHRVLEYLVREGAV